MTVVGHRDPHGPGLADLLERLQLVHPVQAESLATPVPPRWTADELVVASLGEIVHARSGGQGR
jgi:hypothetical protein